MTHRNAHSLPAQSSGDEAVREWVRSGVIVYNSFNQINSSLIAMLHGYSDAIKMPHIPH